MPSYTFTCTNCGYCEDDYTDACAIGSHHPHLTCPECQCRMKRRVTFTYKAPMPAHFNVAIGDYVSSRREWSDGLKKAQDEQSARLGQDVHYTEIDNRDAGALGVTEEGLAKQSKKVDMMKKKGVKL